MTSKEDTIHLKGNFLVFPPRCLIILPREYYNGSYSIYSSSQPTLCVDYIGFPPLCSSYLNDRSLSSFWISLLNITLKVCTKLRYIPSLDSSNNLLNQQSIDLTIYYIYRRIWKTKENGVKKVNSEELYTQ